MKLKFFKTLLVLMFLLSAGLFLFACSEIQIKDYSFVYDGTIKQVNKVSGNVEIKYYYNNTEVQYCIDSGVYRVEYYKNNNLLGTSTLTIEKAEVTVIVPTVSVDFDGTVKTVNPGVIEDISDYYFDVTFNGLASAVEIGEYEVVATLVHKNYFGVGTGTLSIVDNRRISLEDKSVIYTGGEHCLNISNELIGLITILYNGKESLPVDAGIYDVKAYFNNNPDNFEIAQLIILPKEVEITVLNNAFEYDGLSKEVIIENEFDLPMDVLYNEIDEKPTEVGEYDVIITITSDNYTGVLETKLYITAPVIPPEIENLEIEYDGEYHETNILNDDKENYIVTYNGSSVLPKNACEYEVVAEHKTTGNVLNGTLIIYKKQTIISINQTEFYYNSGLSPRIIITNAADASMIISVFLNNEEVTMENIGQEIGTYYIIVSIDDLNYAGTETFEVKILARND